MSTFSDTVVRLQSTYEGWQHFQPFALLTVNLPTGKATLAGSEKFAVMDRDLVYQTRFGEGFNVNPGLGFSFAITGSLVASAGVSYNFRDAYVPDGDLGFEYDPGDQALGTLGLTYIGQSWLATLNAIVTRETTSTLDGVDYFKPGDSFTATANIVRQWNPRNSSSASLQFNHTQKNRSMNLLTGAFGSDGQNSNSDLYVAGLSHHYALDGAWKLFGQFTYLRRTANLFDEVSDFFVPAKEKFIIEGGAAFERGSSSARFSLGYLHMNQDETPYIGAQTYRGVVGHASVKVSF